MPKPRDRQIMVNIEETFYDLLQEVIHEGDMSASSYCRGLIVKDLISRGLLTSEKLQEVVLGKAV